jgi:CheY-like chemotaxis protein
MAHILVIDDDATLRRNMRRALEMDGHQVTEAVNGAEGVRRYRETPVSLVITDILMPDQEGIETIIDLRRRAPALPILAVSGGSLNSDRDGILASADLLGATRILPKPFSLAEFRATVASLLADAPPP